VPLRIRAQAIAEGVYTGPHRSIRKGAGVEFGGHRPYTPGDDLRFIDRRSVLRFDRLLVREFEMETERAVWLCVDATASMSYRGQGPASKLAYASLLCAALARVALSSGDPVGLTWIGGAGPRPLPARGGREAFDRVVGALESTDAAGDLSEDPHALDRALAPLARRSRRGSVIVLLSDLVDLPDGARRSFTSLLTHRRHGVVVQVLDPTEAHLSFDGHVRLRALEGDAVVEADVNAVRDAYLARLEALRGEWSSDLVARGGRFVHAETSDPPEQVVRKIVSAIAGVSS